jgi:hypothetical protein
MPTAIDYLISAQHESGGWGYSTNQQPIVEPTSAVLLALRDEPQAIDAYQRGITWLVNSQHQDGGWGINQNDPESGWQTAWAILVLKQSLQNKENIATAVEWLLTVGTSEVTKEEFHRPELPKSEDNLALIWPWMPGQVGWIEPTAMAVLALDSIADSPLASYRFNAARRYFRENRTPDGGWGIGNAGPLDTVVLPRAYPTSLVLLALVAFAREDIRTQDISALEQDIRRDHSILALSSGLLAMELIGESDDTLKKTLSVQQQMDGSWSANPFFTAWAIMALRGQFP